MAREPWRRASAIISTVLMLVGLMVLLLIGERDSVGHPPGDPAPVEKIDDLQLPTL